MNGLDKRLKVLEEALAPSGPPIFFYWDGKAESSREAYIDKYGEPVPENMIAFRWFGNGEPPPPHPAPWPPGTRLK